MPQTPTTPTYPQSAVSVLAGAIAASTHEDPELLAAELLEYLSVGYDIRRRSSSPADAPKPGVGQVWRNRKTDRLVRIETIVHGNIEWVGLTGKGPGSGSGWCGYWTSRFEYVEDTTAS